MTETESRHILRIEGLMTILLAAVLLYASAADAANTYYVAPDGSDTNPGTESMPLKTVQKGMTQAGAGNTVYIKAGTYDLRGFSKTLHQPLVLIGEDKDSTILTNGGTLIFSQSLTVKNLTFRSYDSTVLRPFAGDEGKLDGVFIENCIFEKLSSAINTGKDPKGIITNVNISNCEFRNMEGGGVSAIAITYGLISDVRIIDNSFKNLKSTRKGCMAVVIGSNATRTTTRDIHISGNQMDTITGPTMVVREAGTEVHGILAYGTNLNILRNTIKNLNAGRDHEAIYMKARNSTIANNVIHNCGSGGGGGDICSKGGELSEGNVITENRITGNQPGRGMLVNGGTLITGNHIKKTNGFNGIDVYAFGKPVTISNNYVETKTGTAIRLDGGKNAVISNNVVICHEGTTIKVRNSTGTKIRTENGEALQRLKVDPSKRFLVRNDGTPLFWLGDTAWFIMRLTDDEIRGYLSNRVEKGFTGIQVDLNPYAWTNLMAPGECENPFLNNNIDTPNQNYWQRVDWMVDEVAHHGLYVLLTPMWGKHYPRYVGADTAKAYDLGKWLGNRYRSKTHVMWFVSGEYDSINGYRPITSAQKALLNAVAQGLEDGHGGNQLMTIHPGARRTSSADFHNEAWLDFNMLQSGHFDDAAKWGSPETYTLITNDYNRTPVKPVFEGEPAYEDMIDGYFKGPRDDSGLRMGMDVMRRKAYWSVFAGGFGHTYGHNDVQIFWSPGKPREAANRNHWRDALEAPGAGQMRHLRSLIEPRSFLNRIPDQSVIASAAGSDKDHVRATRASDGSYVMVYIPTAGEVTIEMSKISGARVKASWFDPRTGTYTAIGDYPNSGTQVFDAPGATAIGNDWVLMLDAKVASEPTD